MELESRTAGTREGKNRMDEAQGNDRNGQKKTRRMGLDREDRDGVECTPEMGQEGQGWGRRELHGGTGRNTGIRLEGETGVGLN